MLSVRLLGSFAVEVDGRPVPAGAWERRDASGLVKLLALRPERRLHREQVMDLMWPELGVSEAAPRLHKAAHYARRALGCADALVLRDDVVALLPGGPVTVDADDFERAAAEALANGMPGTAAAVLDRFPGEPLPDDAYAEWADEARDRLTVLRRRLLRQAGRWEQLLELDPLDEEAAVRQMRRLVRAGDRAGALETFARLDRALRRLLGTGPGPAATRLRDELAGALRERGRLSPADEGRLRQEIRFCRSADGVTLAYASSGNGPPLVKAAHWMTHLDHDWNSPVWHHWLVELSRRFRLIRYDERGCGLSDRDIPRPGFEDWIRDLEAVVDAAGLERFPLFGMSQGVAVAITYAARHPERVSKLVLCGGYLQGQLARAVTEEQRREQGLEIEMVRLGWGRDHPGFRQVFTSQFMPQGSRELWDAFNELQRTTTSSENAARVLELAGSIDVVATTALVRAPALVLHAREDSAVPFAQGRWTASQLPNSRFLALDSPNHILLADEPAWPVFLREVETFLAE
ncbi:alpha/beta hydrolase [Petropleomorpha daqingensis]|uniref:DNA-binding SARP family transcriptional activator/pimeloyl-ACP methyl ester carboxylesterase n=1 Tax=Petropleomorpha daqingensis TaxID=2026353 RepID=A0A853C9A7_9ACTN|nr:DNA-binding SARP family transcriptional activator/pimeloyl-ACP methyl ester carboxylesterase [Petropleomorpha daqingensis]